VSDFSSYTEDLSNNLDDESTPANSNRVEKAVSDEIAIRIEDLSVTYKVQFERIPTAKKALSGMLTRKKSEFKVIQALKDVSLEIKHGTILGVVGHNGAGKSTLLRAVAGILTPTTGRIEVYGEISTLLALGLGFNGQVSGRENVILGGLAAGLTRDEINSRYEEIADFAELGDFIDLPIRTYSSGMSSRLAFSIAVHMNPDILLIDEALSAGDARFKEKASNKMQQLMSEARTMLLVSHGLGSIKELCNEAIMLDKGSVVLRGTPDEVVSGYLEKVNSHSSSVTNEDL